MCFGKLASVYLWKNRSNFFLIKFNLEHNLVFHISYTLNEEWVCRTWSIVGEHAGCCPLYVPALVFPFHHAAMIWSLAEGIGELKWIVSKNELFWFSEKYYFYLHDTDYEIEALEIKEALQGHTVHTASTQWCWDLNTTTWPSYTSWHVPFLILAEKGYHSKLASWGSILNSCC